MEHLRSCLANSTALLALEHKIKEATATQQNLFLTLCAIFLSHLQEPQLQWVAGLLLKNTLKDYLHALKEDPTRKQELEAIKQALFLVAANTSTDKHVLGSKKLQEEYYMVVSGLIVKEFNLNDADTGLFDEIIRGYQRGYNYHMLRIINDVIEDGNDDRMWKFVPQILPATLLYLNTVQENKLLFNVWLLMQTAQWTIGVDQSALDSCFNQEVMTSILGFIMTSSYIKLLAPTPNLSPLQAGQSVDSLQMKRYSSKILTLMFRDFLNSNKTMKSKISQPNVKAVFT